MKVEIGNATVYLGDSLDIMPTLEPVDLLCTDAPYRVTTGGDGQRARMDKGSERQISQFGGWMAEYKNDGDVVTCDIDWSDWLPVAYSCLNNDRQAYFMSNGRQLFEAHAAAEYAGFSFHTLLAWDKRSALPNRWYQNVTEFTLFMRKGKAFTINDPASKNIFSLFQRDESKHPTEKPVELMAHYISNSTQRGQVVLDPFMGSGTTGVAALRLGRKFIGIELERKWFDVACERLSKATDQTHLFDDTPAPLQAGFIFGA